MKTIARFFAFLTLFTLVFGATGVRSVSAANTWTVNTANDSGAGSLRQAIADATSGDTINFAGDYTIHLAGELTINKNLTITGAGHKITLDGQGTTRIIYLNGSGVNLALSHLNFINGKSPSTSGHCDGGDDDVCGGGILMNRATATISNSTFSGNYAKMSGGAIYNHYGSLTVINSTFSGNSVMNGSGGAIGEYSGSLALTNSTISGNSAGVGGGIYAYGGSATFQNSIIANNSGANNCNGTFTDGGGNLVWGDTSCPGTSANPRLGTLGNYGGDTPTLPLLPGSAAIDAGNDTACANASTVNNIDQRGVSRTASGAHCDSGAFESHGFTLTKSGGDSQSIPVYAASANPLVVSVTNSAGEPVDGGVVTFTAPASGASTNPVTNTANIASAMASQSVTANHVIGGPYTVTASTAGSATSITFSLTNTCANTVTVSNNADSGAGSLRQAISVTCAGGTINFNAGYTIPLGSQLEIAQNVTITGAGHKITLDGQGITRIFRITGGNSNFDHLNIVNGKAPDGTTCGDEANAACGGGMLMNTGTTVTVSNSTFSGNDGRMGGGAIYNYYGILNVTNSTFSGNSAMSGFGGAIDRYSGSLTLTNSTISGNSAGAGGGIHTYGGLVTFQNSIIASNSANNAGTGNCLSEYTTSTDNGGNLVWGDTTCPGTNANPRLGTLGDYGGDTPTLPLLPGSAAIDAGNDTACANVSTVNNIDQRGVSRTASGVHCDSGAFESSGFTLTKSSGDSRSTPVYASFTNPLVVSVAANNASEPVNGGVVTFTAPDSGASANPVTNTATIASATTSQSVTANHIVGPYTITASSAGAANVTFSLTNTCANTVTVSNNADSGAGSLRQAIAVTCASGTINFNGDYAISLNSPLGVSKNVTITGAGHKITLDGQQSTRIFNITGGNSTFNHLNIIKGKAQGIDCADSCGGGLRLESGATATISNSTFSGNAAGSAGGAIYSQGDLTMTNSTFSGNSAASSLGGAIEINSGSLTLTNNTVSSNSGGGIHTTTGAVTLRNSIIANNSGANNCNGTFTDGGGNLVWGDTSCPGTNADPRLDTLGNYGGDIPTLPLLPGSAAIDAGNDTACANVSTVNNKDQRGVSRTASGAHCDSGAFESRGFSLGSPTGTSQRAVINTGFVDPLGLTVTANDASEPVSGGVVTFTPPASGASAVISSSPAAIGADGKVSVTATANGMFGDPYNVVANAAGVASGVNFGLTNLDVLKIHFTAQPAKLDNHDSTRFSFESSGGAAPVSFECELDGYGFNPCSSPIDLNSLLDGSHTFQVRGVDSLSNSDIAPYTWEVDATSPNVLIEQASGQVDPANSSPIHFTVTFGEPIDMTTFEATDFTLEGPSSGTLTASITQTASGEAAVFDLAVSGMTVNGPVTVSLGANKVKDLAGNWNNDSFFSDNTVTFHFPIEQTTTTLNFSRLPAESGAGWKLSAIVTSSNLVAPAGTVTFRDGTTLLGTSELVNGTATLDIPALSSGAHQVTAEYGGDENHLGSTSAAVTLSDRLNFYIPLISK